MDNNQLKLMPGILEGIDRGVVASQSNVTPPQGAPLRPELQKFFDGIFEQHETTLRFLAER